MILYGEKNSADNTIGKIAERDLRTGSNVVLMIGTGLKVSEARRLMKELCRVAKHRNEFIIWASKEASPRNLSIAFNAVFLCDCDDLANLL